MYVQHVCARHSGPCSGLTQVSGTKSKPNRVSLEVDGGSVGMALAASCCWLRLRFASRCTAAAGASGLRPLDGLGCLVLGTADTELDAGRPSERLLGLAGMGKEVTCAQLSQRMRTERLRVAGRRACFDSNTRQLTPGISGRRHAPQQRWRARVGRGVLSCATSRSRANKSTRESAGASGCCCDDVHRYRCRASRCARAIAS